MNKNFTHIISISLYHLFICDETVDRMCEGDMEV